LSRALTHLQRLGAPTNAECHAQGWAAIAQARQCGLKDPDDLVAYTWRALLNPGFADQPAYRVAINAAQANPGNLGAALTHIEAHNENQEQLT